MNRNHFLVAFFSWVCLVALDNGFDKDWGAYECINLSCSDAARTISWVSLIVIGLGIGISVVYAAIFFLTNLGKFLLFAVIATGVVCGTFLWAEKHGGVIFANADVMYLVTTLVIFMSGASVTAVDTSKRRRS